MTLLPQATQDLKDNKITRRSLCPDHTQWTSNYQGVQEYQEREVWLFRCKDDGIHSQHYFIAEPDKTAPHTQEEVGKWLEKRRGK